MQNTFNLRALLNRVKPAAQRNYTIVHSTVKNETAASNGKKYIIICENNLDFTKDQILQLEDAQADLLEQILKLRKVTKKLKAYEANFKAIDKNN